MEATTTIRDQVGRPAFIQYAVFTVSLGLILWSVAGLIANPDFATGDAATAKQVLGVDFNGWHAVSGFLLVGPGLAAALRPDWALAFAGIAFAALAASAVYALFSTRPADVLAFPNNESDAVLHFGFAALYGGAALIQLRRGRRA
jgi:uncharacterized protein DUF4383